MNGGGGKKTKLIYTCRKNLKKRDIYFNIKKAILNDEEVEESKKKTRKNKNKKKESVG